jgi:protein-tyrosine phosphatase
MGNICRSPLAEAALRDEARRLGLDLEVDSAGTGSWHVGNGPDGRAVTVARRNGIDIGHLRARQVVAEDFRRFDHIMALDTDVLAALERLRPGDGKASLSLLLDHVEGREGHSVADPYYGDDAHFDRTWSDVTEAARALADKFAGSR